ncbi:MAG TPA: DUF3810 family protein [Vicinamibacterales bacterium]|nr:DUF3810 family protein [Vicinamibacterales bacterium]
MWKPLFPVALAALGAAWLDPPGWLVRRYGEVLYPAVQARLTPLSNLTSWPLFDLTWMSLAVGVIAAAGVAVRRACQRRRFRPVVRALGAALFAAAVCYLWFLAVWGYNYRRPGVEQALAGFDASRATPAAVRALAERSVAEANAGYDEAHALGFPALNDLPADLVASLHAVERALGRARPTTPSRPKRPLTAPYMRAVGVSGMLAPFFLETYLNPDLTGPERPIVLAHEWAHLSGFAPEEDASFVGVLAALGGEAASRYSAWLFLVSESTAELQPVTRGLVLERLADGPRRDLTAIAARLQLRVPWLDRASWVAYDRALKSQGAESGVAGYGRVIQLLLGSGALERERFAP